MLDLQIRAGQAGEAIEYARSHVVPLLSATQLPPPQQQHPEPASVGAPRSLSSDVRAAWPSPADRELLEDATALLAYEDASTAPTGVANGRVRCRGGCCQAQF